MKITAAVSHAGAGAPPIVLGQEGAGVVEAVGAGVTRLVPGDPCGALGQLQRCVRAARSRHRPSNEHSRCRPPRPHPDCGTAGPRRGPAAAPPVDTPSTSRHRPECGAALDADFHDALDRRRSFRDGRGEPHAEKRAVARTVPSGPTRRAPVVLVGSTGAGAPQYP
ncbi:alcohol dehydrogenase catalytic domain-containing protein [Streptomyces sp. DSM 15324]|uniref:alcohol dehydrogenase catalytic domain-containing protein n=1 Tax=Streptomyces sp. DSM 15324 TaxID=1739111 RepID=UPI003B63208F